MKFKECWECGKGLPKRKKKFCSYECYHKFYTRKYDEKAKLSRQLKHSYKRNKGQG